MRLLLAVVVLVSACSSDPQPAPWTTIPVARCGMPAYSLLDPAGLGAVVSHEETVVLNLDPAAVNALIEPSGYTSLLPVPYGSRVFRYRYTTQDRGQKVEATGTLGLPAGADLSTLGELPIVLFLHGTTGFSDACSPGRDIDGQAPAALFGALGYVAVLPDYIGMASLGDPSITTHGYLVAEQAAIGSWDAVRAARSLLGQLDVGVDASSKVIVWGGSQGGHAAMVTELYAPYYAPEFQVPGVVALVPPLTLAPLAQIAVTGWGPPTLAFASVLATMHRWYASPPLSLALTDAEPYRFASTIDAEVFVQGECNTGEGYDPLRDHPDQQVPATVYAPAFIDSVKAGKWSEIAPFDCYLSENAVATSPVKPLRHTPTLTVFSEKDDLVVTAPQRDAFDTLCAAGYRLDFLECTDAKHTEGALWSLPEQLAWVKDRLAGKPQGATTCARHAPTCCTGTPADRCAQ